MDLVVVVAVAVLTPIWKSYWDGVGNEKARAAILKLRSQRRDRRQRRKRRSKNRTS